MSGFGNGIVSRLRFLSAASWTPVSVSKLVKELASGVAATQSPPATSGLDSAAQRCIGPVHAYDTSFQVCYASMHMRKPLPVKREIDGKVEKQRLGVPLCVTANTMLIGTE